MSPQAVTGDPATTAVLVVECQNGVVGPGSALRGLPEAAAPVLPTIGRLARGARDAGVLVVHLTAVPAPLGREATNRKPVLFAGIMDSLKGWDRDHPATQVVPEIGVDPRDLVLERHSGLSPTYGTETFKILRNFGITTLVVAGVSTNIAIPVALTEAVDEGFSVVVARDAVAGSPPEHAESMLRYTIGLIATLTTTDDLLAHWAKA